MYSFVGIIVLSLVINFFYISNKVIKPSNSIIKSEYIEIQKDEIYKEVEFALKILQLLKEENNIRNNNIPDRVIAKAIDLINQYNKNNDNYIFALDNNWNVIIHQDKSSIKTYNDNFQHAISTIKNAIESGENWVSYDNRPEVNASGTKNLKYSYVTYLPEWKMTIGSGYLENKINNNADNFIQKANILINENKTSILIINLSLILSSVLFAMVSSVGIKLHFIEHSDNINKQIKKTNKLLLELDAYTSRDPITNIPNKVALKNLIEKTKLISERFNYQVHIFEIDNFNHRSLISGCSSRESILEEFSNSLVSVSSEHHNLFHIEHDRFILLTKDIDNTDDLKQKILSPLEDSLSNILLCGNASKIAFLCSTVRYDDKTENLESILEKCEYALRYTQNNKLNHVTYCERVDEKRNREFGLSLELMSAIQNDELKVHYQPQFCSQSNRVTGLEALVRWNNRLYQDVSPAEFIPLAEIKGQIHDIGVFVIRTALRDMEKFENLTMTINLLPIELLSPSFESFVRASIDDLNIDTSRLIFDITKQIPIKDLAKASQVMNNLSAIGVRFSISSVGLGQSSLKYICELPVDEIKIPIEIIKKIKGNNKYQCFVKSVIEFANSTGLRVIIEGVETQSQYQQLAGLGKLYIQGFNLSEAKPVDQIISELTEAWA